MNDDLMENFLGLLKTEMFYGKERNYHDLKELEQPIVKYIDYYNNERTNRVQTKRLNHD